MTGHRDQTNSITVEGVSLVFPNGYVGLKETSLHVPRGEFCTLLGASGSGKTTLLRVIAGLLEPTSGRVRVGKEDVTNRPIQDRNIGFVFQNYALFPHMTVAENIEYPLKVHRWAPNDRADRVRQVLELIELPHVAKRAVGDLSGGQQQRVAIGRALSYRPLLLLLDEPMGALDRRLRQQLGRQLREIQRAAGVTAVYVTHDQEEAFILSDRIAIMEKGEILQYAEPQALYYRPNSGHVATFLGEANLFPVTSIDRNADSGFTARTGFGEYFVAEVHYRQGRDPTMVVRPEQIRLVTSPDGSEGFVSPVPVTIVEELFLGSRCLLTLRTSDGATVLVECLKADIPPQGSPAWMTWKRGDAVIVSN